MSNYQKDIVVIRVLDSRNEGFVLSKAYRDKVKVYNVITSPKIEILVIIAKNKYDDYCKVKSKMKASDYCKDKLKIKKVKKPDFILEFFSDIDLLVDVLKKHQSYQKKISDRYHICDLLRP